MLIQLQAVSDPVHERFYGKPGYKTASNPALKTKALQGGKARALKRDAVLRARQRGRDARSAAGGHGCTGGTS